MQNNDAILNMVISKDLLDRVREIAKSNNISLASQVRMILTQYCNNIK